MKKLFFITLITVFSAWIQPATAYIDPGSGSAIMSAIIGLFVAAGMVIKTYWYKLKSLFTGSNESVKSEITDSDERKSDEYKVD